MTFAEHIGAILGRLVGVLVRKGILTETDKAYIMGEIDDV